VRAEPEPAKCERCGLLIFDSLASAATVGIRFSPYVNLRSGRLCIGCAGGDQVRVSPIMQPADSAFESLRLRPPQKTEVQMPRGKKQQTTEAPETAVFTEFEVGVPAPIGRNPGKYDGLEKAVLSVPLNGAGASEWMRFLLPGKSQARAAQGHLRKRSSDAWKAEGHDVAMRTVPQADGAVWLYVQRKKHEGGDGG
jgi:hypothetical protein